MNDPASLPTTSPPEPEIFDAVDDAMVVLALSGELPRGLVGVWSRLARKETKKARMAQ